MEDGVSIDRTGDGQGDLKPIQGELEQTFIKIISASEGYPLPGRAFRNLVGRSLVALYTRGETRTLFDTLQALLRLVGDVKSLEKDVVRMYVVMIHFNMDLANKAKSCIFVYWRLNGRIWISSTYIIHNGPL